MRIITALRGLISPCIPNLVPLDGSDLAELALTPAQLIAEALCIPVELVEAFDVLPPAVHNRSTRMALEQMLA